MVIRLDENYNAMTSTALLGYVGETNARPVSVEGLTVDGADRYVLTIDYGDGTAYEVDITGGTWTPTADILRVSHNVSCQISARRYDNGSYTLVKKSKIFSLRIGQSVPDGVAPIPSPSVAADALDRISEIGEQAHADMQTAQSAAETATTAANNAEKSATTAGLSADTATQAAERAETAQTAAEMSTTQAETAKQGAENARAEAVTAQNAAKISAAQASASAQQTTADKTATAGYAQTAKTNADSTAADRQAVQEMATQVTADKATVADHAAKVAEDRTAAETAAQTAQAVADSLPDDYVTAVGKIAENTAEIGRVKLTDKELQRRVNALYDMGQGVTHRFETDSDTAYQKTVPTGAKLMSVKSIGGHSEVIDGEIVSAGTESVVEQGRNLFDCYGFSCITIFNVNSERKLNNSYGTTISTIEPTNKIVVTQSQAPESVIVHPNNGWFCVGIKGMEQSKRYTFSFDFTATKMLIQNPVLKILVNGRFSGDAININEFNVKKRVSFTFEYTKLDDRQYIELRLSGMSGIFENFQLDEGSTATAYAPFHRNTYQIPEAIKALPGYGVEGNVVDYEAKIYTQNNAVDGMEIKALETPIVTDISNLIDDDFLRNIEVEAGGSITFKNSNGDSYRIPVPSEEEYIVKLSEVGGTT